MLATSVKSLNGLRAPVRSDAVTENVIIPSGGVLLEGELILPANASGVVLFAHGSGSSRFSARNQFVASTIRQAGIGTLLFDLLTREEEMVDRHTRHLRFDIDLLARRLMNATRWISDEPETRDLPIGYFGASTGGAAALVAAAEFGDSISAVVSRGGRPDLAGESLKRVEAPTLLIVGGKDDVVLSLNRDAFEKLNCEKELKIIPGATHLFEEPGALKYVSHMASDWFAEYLA